MRISDWSSDVCSSDLVRPDEMRAEDEVRPLVDQNFVAIDRLGEPAGGEPVRRRGRVNPELEAAAARRLFRKPDGGDRRHGEGDARNTAIVGLARWTLRSEEHTSELQSLMRISYAVFC